MAAVTKSKTKSGDSFFEIVKTVVTVGLVVLILRTFAFEPFNIPSGSMIPTLLIGDYVFVSKYSYGFSRYSFPLIHPPFSGRIFGRLPARGDVVVFKLPRDPSVDYIKRVIGLPGDKIQMVDGVLNVNGKPVELSRTEDFYDTEYQRNIETPQFIETLPEGRQHPILKLQKPGTGTYDNTPVFEVPADSIFAMGDNRDNSLDSRVPPRNNGVGFVPLENLVGRAEFRFFSYDDNVAPWWQVWEWPWAIRFSRMFTGVH
ncbi:signal peptidase I [Aliidongia dinghuensis]|uniref:Signal peptidase I n=1 Tax=Aliidongia dinghuensis TaxID=1867774 RepID=A0A8J2Z0U6_9PROT|nr:signal peptidase I [Aliidongia dinghuensis]GGF41032.1 signal peptidase I [Aliidongia dinghuensis]